MKKLFMILFFFTVVSYSQWVIDTNGIGNKEVESMTANGSYIFAGTLSSIPSGVYMSTNNGTNWSQTSLNNQNIYSLTSNGNYIFAGTAFLSNGVYRSTNNGTNWTQTSLNNQSVFSLASNGINIFAGTNNGVFLSTNNGTNWTQTSLNNQTVNTFAVNGNNVFAGTNGVYLTTNNGTNWTQTSLNLVVYSLGVNGNYVFAGTRDSGVYLSTNNGTNWIRTTLTQQVTSLAFNGNNVFAGTCCSGVYVSNNNGTSWIQRNEGMSNTSVNDLCILNTNIFAGTGAKGTGIVWKRPLFELVVIQPISDEIPKQFHLSQNYPNPFNPLTIIEFRIAEFGFVNLTIFDVIGREVETLVNEELKPGTYKAKWDAANNSSGVYLYKLISGEFSDSKPMVLVK